jgi:hypothetical protein
MGTSCRIYPDVSGFAPNKAVSTTYFVTNFAVEMSTGKDIGEHITDLVK